MSEERRIVCRVQPVIGCTSWEAPKSIKTLYISPHKGGKKHVLEMGGYTKNKQIPYNNDSKNEARDKKLGVLR